MTNATTELAAAAARSDASPATRVRRLALFFLAACAASFLAGSTFSGWLILWRGETVGEAIAVIGAQIANAALDPRVDPSTPEMPPMRMIESPSSATTPTPMRSPRPANPRKPRKR